MRRNVIPSFPRIAPSPALQPWAIQGKEGITFCCVLPSGQSGPLQRPDGPARRLRLGGRLLRCHRVRLLAAHALPLQDILRLDARHAGYGLARTYHLQFSTLALRRQVV